MTNLIRSNAELLTCYLVWAVTAPDDEFPIATKSVVRVSELLSTEEHVRATEVAIREVQQIPVEKRGRALEDLEIVLAGRKQALARKRR